MVYNIYNSSIGTLLDVFCKIEQLVSSPLVHYGWRSQVRVLLLLLIYKTNDIEMIKGDIEIRCNDCSTSFFIPVFNILIADDAMTEVKKIMAKEGWLYKNMSECYCRNCRKKFD